MLQTSGLYCTKHVVHHDSDSEYDFFFLSFLDLANFFCFLVLAALALLSVLQNEQFLLV
jgi:hypothetical protein